MTSAAIFCRWQLPCRRLIYQRIANGYSISLLSWLHPVCFLIVYDAFAKVRCRKVEPRITLCLTILGLPQDIFSNYEIFFEKLLLEFCSKHSPCTYENQRGICVNYQKTHTKGHQDESGAILAAGVYQSDFTYESYRDTWMAKLRRALERWTTEFNEASKQEPHMDEQKLILEHHSTTLNSFYTNTDQTDTFRSHEACLSCFTDISQHSLPCGHIICTACVKAWGTCKDTLTYRLNCCPIHAHKIWQERFTATFKPDFAGLRVLSLDG